MRLWRYCLAGLLYDWLLYVTWTVIPIRAEALGTTATQLGLLQTCWSGVYVLNSILMGALADRLSKAAMARVACLAAGAACFAFSRAGGLWSLFAIVPLLSLAASTFWPSIQGAIGSETEPARMEKALGLFNILWSVGKSLGFVMAGWMTGTLGAAHTLWAAAAGAGAIVLFYPWRDGPAASRGEHEDAPGRPAFLLMGYVANFLAFGVARTVEIHFFKYLTAADRGHLFGRTTFFGLFLGITYLAQTGVFFVLQRNAAWTYRRAPLYAAQALMGTVCVSIPFVGNDAVILALAAVLGVGLGFAYASSIYYSLHGPVAHGRFSGIHEAVLGAGTVLVPLSGGLLADWAGDLRVPYALAAATVLAGMAVEEGIYRTKSRSSGNREILKSAPSSSPGLK